MTEANIKAESGNISVTVGTQTELVTDPADVRSLNDLVAQRQKVGLEISRVLKQHGFHSMNDDEPTEVIEPD